MIVAPGGRAYVKWRTILSWTGVGFAVGVFAGLAIASRGVSHLPGQAAPTAPLPPPEPPRE